MDLRAIERDGAQLQHAHLARHQQHLNEQPLDLREKSPPKRRKGVVVGMLVRRQEAHGDRIGVLKGHSLDRRINNQEDPERESAAWERQRNASGARMKWMFTTEKAPAKMGRASPNPRAPFSQPA